MMRGLHNTLKQNIKTAQVVVFYEEMSNVTSSFFANPLITIPLQKGDTI